VVSRTFGRTTGTPSTSAWNLIVRGGAANDAQLAQRNAPVLLHRVEHVGALEQTLLFADIWLFAVIFLSGIAVFAVETVRAAKRRIEAALRENHRDE